MAAAVLVAGTSLAQAPAATAYPTATVEVSGNGYGHGRGLGQWGALGYALDFGWAYQRILDHYYGGTTAGSLGGDPLITVRLTRFDGAETMVQQERGEMTTSAAPGTFGALRARRVGPNTFDVERAADCGGEWSPVARVSGPVTFSPQVSATDDHTRMLQACEPDGGRRWLRGQLLAVDDAGVQKTVNRLSMEAYLRGVVPREMPASWGPLGGGAGMHALRAQAVAARSYAAAENRSPFAQTCDTISCQVYGGVAFQGSGGSFTRLEQATTDAAVRDTAGQVRLTSAGAVARTEFSSSSGGWTAGGTFPAVRDEGDDTRSPYRPWTASIRVTDIEAAYPHLGSLQAIEVTERNGLGEWGGRVGQVALRGSSATVSLTGAQFRSRFGLRSDWFVVHPPPPPPLTWLLRNSSSGGTADLTFAYGRAGDVPVVGDWDGDADGDDTVGIVRDGVFHLRDANAGGVADVSFRYGRAGDVAVVGDWDGDGDDTVGIVRDGVFHLRDANAGGVADMSFRYGRGGDMAVVGDWDGDGDDTVGIVRDGVFHLRNANSGGVADLSFSYGRAGDVAVVGDWDGDGDDTVGIVRDGVFHLRNANSGGVADLSFSYGRAGDVAVVGDWDGDGDDTVGIVRDGVFQLRNTNSGGLADMSFPYGRAGDVAVVGDWDGDRDTTPGVIRQG